LATAYAFHHFGKLFLGFLAVWVALLACCFCAGGAELSVEAEDLSALAAIAGDPAVRALSS